MFVRQHQNQFRNSNADVQMFYAPFTTSAQPKASWNKPVGVSHVYIMLIGAGSISDGTGNGGGSGAVTVWYGAAQNVPDSLLVKVDLGNNGDKTAIYGKFSGSAFTELLRANSATASSITAGAASSNTSAMQAMGFYQSVAGQDGTSGAQSASTTTFLSGATAGANTVTANYGYATATSGAGNFFLQPIIVGLANAGAATRQAGIGCGSGSTTGFAGNGFALIASW